MSADVTTDQKLLQILTTPRPATIDQVIDYMTRIDAALPGSDGLKWFNWLYLQVTIAVKAKPPAGGWKNPQWITRLDVVFANFYFRAIESALSGTGRPPKSWQVLFDARHQPGIDRIQFALAGMNAHINHDLSLALLQTTQEFASTPGHSSPEHDDFQYVNGILEGLLPVTLHELATGLVGGVVQSTGKIGRLLAMWNVRAARDLAWDYGDHLRGLPRIARDFSLAMQDKLTGALGRGLLLLV